MEKKTNSQEATIKSTTRTELSECPIHKTDMRVLNISVGGFSKKLTSCKSCEEESKNKERQELNKKKSLEDQLVINSLLDNAAISSRFHDKTIYNWLVESEDQRYIIDKIKSFLSNPEASTGLIFCGRPGTGKNHLACGVARHFIKNKKSALVTTAFEMVSTVKESWRNNGVNEKQIIDKFVKVKLLVIDEVGVQFGSDTEMLYLTMIINKRYENQNPTILISNLSPKEITGFLGERIIDRFKEGGHMLAFTWESYRGRKA